MYIYILSPVQDSRCSHCLSLSGLFVISWHYQQKDQDIVQNLPGIMCSSIKITNIFTP